ncbi:hypothetical protein APV28_3342 [Comamonas testosteroni]|nr:hypothetical protein APV28_3342 [Comamonas testosteroni]
MHFLLAMTAASFLLPAQPQRHPNSAAAIPILGEQERDT